MIILTGVNSFYVKVMVVPWPEKRELYAEISKAIYKSVSGLKAKQEPDYIAALVHGFSLSLRDILQSYIPGRFRVGGCFIHQKPLAEFCDSFISRRSPEIGDLLIVYKEIHPDDEVRYNALLLQAKKTTHSVYRTHVSQNDRHQLILYTKWPKFTYVKAGRLNGQTRDIVPKTITSGAQYLLIDEHNSYPCCSAPSFWCAMPQEHLVASNSLALQIVKFLEFQVGRPFVNEPNKEDHWSQMIWDLLSISAESTFNRRRAGYCNQPRSSDDIFSILLGNDNQQETYDIPEDGISVLCIEGRIGSEEVPR